MDASIAWGKISEILISASTTRDFRVFGQQIIHWRQLAERIMRTSTTFSGIRVVFGEVRADSGSPEATLRPVDRGPKGVELDR